MAAKEALCDSCGRTLFCDIFGAEAILVGAQVTVTSTPENEAKVKEAMSPYEINKEYKVCFPCLLSALGIRP